MVKNYFKIAVRNLLKYRTYSLINILGLALGIGCCLLIYLYVSNEWGYDTFHASSDRIYRVTTEQTDSEGNLELNVLTPFVMGPELASNFPEIENYTRILQFSDLVKYQPSDQTISHSITMADSTFFRMFDFELTGGSRENPLDRPGNMVITASRAEQYFGDSDPLHKSMHVKMGSSFREFTITGIVEDPPENSSINFEFLIAFENSREFYGSFARQSWFFNVPETYVRLRDNRTVRSLTSKFPVFLQQVLGENYRPGGYKIDLQPLTDIHLDTGLPEGYAKVSDPVYSYILSGIALLILLLACINFAMLSISRSVSRAREVGVRKVAGARRYQLAGQFWGEALLTTLLSIGAGIGLAKLSLPFFNKVSDQALSIVITPGMAALLAGMAVLISLVAGVYPALLVSGLKPTEIFKGRVSLGNRRNYFRKGMVVTQFSLSILLISGTFVVNEQLQFMKEKDLGFNKEQVLVMETGIGIDYAKGLVNTLRDAAEEAERKKELLLAKLQQAGEIESVAFSTFTPVQQAGWFTGMFDDLEGRKREFHFNIVGREYLDTIDAKIAEGRNFSPDLRTDAEKAIIVNHALVEYFGWEDPLGRQLPGEKFGEHEIVGVVENFHFESLHAEIKPLVLVLNPEPIFAGLNNLVFTNSPAPRISVRFKSGGIPKGMEQLKAAWEQISPGLFFNYTFVDQSVDSQYRSENRLGTLANIGSMIAIAIACMGLFGLSALTVVRRTKEIGIRKVLGATSTGILLLVNREFSTLILVAFLTAVPAGWYLQQLWMKQFAYTVETGFIPFLLSGLITMAVAWLTVSYHAVRAAGLDPVESLKDE